MKKLKSHRAPLIVERIVEDLGQQDVLPPGDSPEFIESPDAVMDALDHLSRWDEPVGGSGRRAVPVPLENETNTAEALVTRGLDEADEELRDIGEGDEAS